MRFFIGTFLLGCSILLIMLAIKYEEDAMRKPAAQAEYISNFNEQLALSPGMFDGAMKQDRPDLDHELRGGNLLDGVPTRVLIFRPNHHAPMESPPH
jgi:hypothetical protein